MDGRQVLTAPHVGRLIVAESKARPTMKDVARHASVSVSTVSYVLNGTGPVSQERRERVLQAVKMLNYTPNEAARGLRQRSAPTVGLIVPDLTNPYFAMIAEGVERYSSERDALVVLCAPEVAGTSSSEPTTTRLLRSQRLSGCIFLSGASAVPRSLMELTELGPVVLVDELLPGFGLPAVVSDNRSGARAVAAHVLSMGHRRVAIIGGPSTLWSSHQRLAGYREAFASGGIEPDSIPLEVGDYRQESGFDAARLLMERSSGKDRITALVCANDLMAVGAIEYLRSQSLRVPEDVSVVGFDDVPFARSLTPRLTTVRQPAHDMGARAAELLFSLLEDPTTPPPDYQPLPVELMVRDSVVPPKA